MTLKALAHAAHHTLQTRAGCNIPHSHIYELLAAAFGYSTWASLRADALLADNNAGETPSPAVAPQVIGRALHLQYAQAVAHAMADALADFIGMRQLTVVRWATLEQLLLPVARYPASTDLDAAELDDEPDEAPVSAPTAASAMARDRLLASTLLVETLEQTASVAPWTHQLLAALYRCAKPNPYLYEESLKGRALTTIERGWVEDYLKLAPRHRKYEAHLKAAAEGGVRACALEYGTVFERPEFIALAERLDGDVDPEQMALVASTPQARARWLRQAAQVGSGRAMEVLADLGDAWAEEHMGGEADSDWLRRAAERAIVQGDALRAWTWQYVALARGDDLTRSTLTARHDGGTNDGQFYDSDFGGPLYVDGDEALVLPALDLAQHREAKSKARDILRR